MKSEFVLMSESEEGRAMLSASKVIYMSLWSDFLPFGSVWHRDAM